MPVKKKEKAKVLQMPSRYCISDEAWDMVKDMAESRDEIQAYAVIYRTLDGIVVSAMDGDEVTCAGLTSIMNEIVTRQVSDK